MTRDAALALLVSLCFCLVLIIFWPRIVGWYCKLRGKEPPPL